MEEQVLGKPQGRKSAGQIKFFREGGGRGGRCQLSIIRFISHAMFCFFLQISCSIELKSLDYRHVLYFWKGLCPRMSEMMFRRYIGNISVCGTDV